MSLTVRPGERFPNRLALPDLRRGLPCPTRFREQCGFGL